MAQLKSVTTAGKGLVGVILPDVTTSARYTSYDLPYLTQAFTAAGYKSSDFKIDNAQGTTTTELAIAQADITAGAKLLLVDPLDSTTGNQIQAAAAQAGIPMISYDRATFQGTNTYYVSFDNVHVGKLIGQGLVSCASAWGVTKPSVLVMKGAEGRTLVRLVSIETTLYGVAGSAFPHTRRRKRSAPLALGSSVVETCTSVSPASFATWMP